VIKDDAISEVAAMQPHDMDDLRSLRGTRSNMSDNTSGKIIAMLQEVYDAPESELPKLPPMGTRPYVPPVAADLLRILLKDRAENAEVATRLIASADDLDDLASGKRDNIHCLHGWRFEIFGQYALKLLAGEVAVSAGKKGLKIIELAKAA
jgi:ribonuclease D